MYNQQNSAFSTIQPGQNAVFNFYFYANPVHTCQTNNEYVNLVFDGRQWLNSGGIFWPLTEGCYNGTFVGETLPTPGLVPGDNPVTNTTKIRFTNTGNLTWYNDGWFRLAYVGSGCSPFYDSATWINCNRASSHVLNVSNPGKSWVDPGETGEFDVVLNVPATTLPGSVGNPWSLVDEWAMWLPSAGHTSTYTVVA